MSGLRTFQLSWGEAEGEEFFFELVPCSQDVGPRLGNESLGTGITWASLSQGAWVPNFWVGIRMVPLNPDRLWLISLVRMPDLKESHTFVFCLSLELILPGIQSMESTVPVPTQQPGVSREHHIILNDTIHARVSPGICSFPEYSSVPTPWVMEWWLWCHCDTLANEVQWL